MRFFPFSCSPTSPALRINFATPQKKKRIATAIPIFKSISNTCCTSPISPCIVFIGKNYSGNCGGKLNVPENISEKNNSSIARKENMIKSIIIPQSINFFPFETDSSLPPARINFARPQTNTQKAMVIMRIINGSIIPITSSTKSEYVCGVFILSKRLVPLDHSHPVNLHPETA